MLGEGFWPADLIESGDGSVLDRIAYEDDQVVGTEDQWGCERVCGLSRKLRLPCPLLKPAKRRGRGTP